MIRRQTLGLLSTALLATGCFSTRLTQTAEPIGEGLSELSLSFNSTQITSIAGEDVGGFWPNLIRTYTTASECPTPWTSLET